MGAAADDDEDDELFAPFKKQLNEQVRGCTSGWKRGEGWGLHCKLAGLGAWVYLS